MEDWTEYSEMVSGDPGNYRWPVRFDYNTRGYLGIYQVSHTSASTTLAGPAGPKPRALPVTRSGTSHAVRVLLSPGQVKALKAFIARPVVSSTASTGTWPARPGSSSTKDVRPAAHRRIRRKPRKAKA